MSLFTYPAPAVSVIGGATEAKQDAAIVVLESINTAISNDTPVDFLDAGVLDSSSTNIPTTGVQIVSSLAANVVKLEVVDDIGEYMALTDGSDTILTYLPLGGGVIEVQIPASTEIKLTSLTGATISVGKITINFLG